ncbi:hypothetical protein FACS189421_06930 [Bacteroidia bacterium]|nr:hypothetical protein FACS189421_06930 [Bacteroidia bacterium]
MPYALTAAAVDFPSGGMAAAGGQVRGAGVGAFAQQASGGAPIGGSPGFLSNYGQIQNVQSYSSNPWYSPDSPYNQRFPVPIYAQGTELTAAECRSMAAQVVAQQCSMNNNCAGMRLMDIRPAIVVAMSNIDGHNYISSCGGFIDAAFNDYMAVAANFAPAAAGFPPAQGGASGGNQFEVDNPYQITHPQWYQEIGERMGERIGLQKQNADSYKLVATQMPGTISDASFETRMQNTASGLAPYANQRAYQQHTVQSNEDAWRDKNTVYTNKDGALQAEAKAEQSKKDLLKIQDYCKWCDENQQACLEDIVKKREEANRTAKENLCTLRQDGYIYDYYNKCNTANPKMDASIIKSPDCTVGGRDLKYCYALEEGNMFNPDKTKFKAKDIEDARVNCPSVKKDYDDCLAWVQKENTGMAHEACWSKAGGETSETFYLYDADKCPAHTKNMDDPKTITCPGAPSGGGGGARNPCAGLTGTALDQCLFMIMCLGITDQTERDALGCP